MGLGDMIMCSLLGIGLGIGISGIILTLLKKEIEWAEETTQVLPRIEVRRGKKNYTMHTYYLINNLWFEQDNKVDKMNLLSKPAQDEINEVWAYLKRYEPWEFGRRTYKKSK